MVCNCDASHHCNKMSWWEGLNSLRIKNHGQFSKLCVWVCVCASLLSHVWLFVTPWTVAHQDPLSMGILQARILEWVAMPSSRGSSQLRGQTQVSCIADGVFTIWATREAQYEVPPKYPPTGRLSGETLPADPAPMVILESVSWSAPASWGRLTLGFCLPVPITGRGLAVRWAGLVSDPPHGFHVGPGLQGPVRWRPLQAV